MGDWRHRLDFAADLLLAGTLLISPLTWGQMQVRGLATAAVLVALAWLLIAISARPPAGVRLTRSALNLPVAALVLAAAVSGAVTVSRFATGLEVCRLTVGTALFLALARAPASTRRAYLSLGALALGAAVCSWLGAREYIFQWLAAHNPYWRTFGGVFLNPNAFAGYLIVALPVIVALTLAARTGSLRLVMAAAAVLAAIALALSGSRGGQLAFVPSFLIFLLLAGHALRRGRLAWGLAAALVGVVLLATLAITPLRVRVAGLMGGQDASMLFRYYVWQAAVRQFAAHPALGTGAGTFQLVYPQYSEVGFTRMAHQNYLQIAAETGTVGLLAFLWMGGAFLFTLRRGWRAWKEPPVRLLLAAAAGGGTALLLHSLVEFDWYIGPIMLAWFALLGMAANLAPGPEAPAAAPSRRRRWRRPLVMLGAVVLAGWVLSNTLSAARSEWAVARGSEAEMAGDYARAREAYQQALAVRPDDPEALRRCARLSGPDQAPALARRAIRLEPTNALNHALLARIYARLGRWQEAVREYQRALHWNRNYPAAHRELAQTLELMGQVREANVHYQTLIELQGGLYERYRALQAPETEYAYGHYWRGRGIMNRRQRTAHDLARAAAEFGEGLRLIMQARQLPTVMQMVQIGAGKSGTLPPDLVRLEARIRFRLAQVLEAQGKKQEAAGQRARAQALFPEVAAAVAMERRITL